MDQDWAARRLLEYAPYAEIVRLIGFPKAGWEAVRWINAPPPDAFLSQLNELGEKLLFLE